MRTPESRRAKPTALARAENALLWIACTALALIVLVISVSALGRYLFHSPIPGSDTIIAVFLAPAVTFLSLAAGLRDKRHVALTALINRLRPNQRRHLHVLVSLGAAGLLGLVAWKTGVHTYDAVRTQRFEATTELPLAMAFAVVPIGCTFAALRLVLMAFAQSEQDEDEAA